MKIPEAMQRASATLRRWVTSSRDVITRATDKPDDSTLDPPAVRASKHGTQGQLALAMEKNPKKALQHFRRALEEAKPLLEGGSPPPALAHTISFFYMGCSNALVAQKKIADAEGPATKALELRLLALKADPSNLEYAINTLTCHESLAIIHKGLAKTQEEAHDRELILASKNLIVEIGSQKLDSFDIEGARHAFETVLETDAAEECKFKAFVGLLIIKAVTSSEVIPLPGVPFEYMVMKKHFCVTCKVPTKNWRRSGETKYLSNAIIDCWYAECPKCQRSQRVLFGVPKD